MYVDPFVAGVIATVVVELIIVIVIILRVGSKKKSVEDK